MHLNDIDFLFLDYVSDGAFHISMISPHNVDEKLSRPKHFLRENQVFEKINFLQSLGLVKFENDGFVHLTKKGGIAWEEKFSVKWEAYIDFGLVFKFDRDFGVVRSISYDKLACIMRLGADYARFNKIKTITDWSPYYWKDKVTAYQLLFVFNDISANLGEFCRIVGSVRGPWRKDWVNGSYQDGIAWPTEG